MLFYVLFYVLVWLDLQKCNVDHSFDSGNTAAIEGLSNPMKTTRHLLLLMCRVNLNKMLKEIATTKCAKMNIS